MSENTNAAVITEDAAAIEAAINADTESVDEVLASDEVEETESADEQKQYSNLTPHAAARVASLVLGKTINPQVMYGYAKSGRIDSNYEEFKALGGRGKGLKVMFVGNAFREWLVAAKNGSIQAGGGKVDIDALVEQFDV